MEYMNGMVYSKLISANLYQEWNQNKIENHIIYSLFPLVYLSYIYLSTSKIFSIYELFLL